MLTMRGTFKTAIKLTNIRTIRRQKNTTSELEITLD